MRVDDTTNIRARLINFRVDESFTRYMLSSFAPPAGKIDLHHFIRVQWLWRDPHPRKQQSFTLRFLRQAAAHVAENIGKFSVQNTRAEKHVIREFFHGLLV